MAAEKAKGPGTLRLELMDALYLLNKDDILARAKFIELV